MLIDQLSSYQPKETHIRASSYTHALMQKSFTQKKRVPMFHREITLRLWETTQEEPYCEKNRTGKRVKKTPGSATLGNFRKESHWGKKSQGKSQNKKLHEIATMGNNSKKKVTMGDSSSHTDKKKILARRAWVNMEERRRVLLSISPRAKASEIMVIVKNSHRTQT
ncbi:hypothetical protein BgiMline_014207 [Biomphalaria glabrata]|nr:hypothetical protein BgiMline_012989 [Biomphalaria glabrata]KAI8773144.1 hypothetical protein BgiBS90_025562 [Biomphalaria glabrata]